SNNVNHPDFADRSAQNIADEINDFLPEGLERVTDVDIYYTDVSLSITQLHIIEDREFLGPGSMFLNVLLNDDHDSHNYIFDNGGSYYVANDGTYLDVDISLTTYLYSMDGWFAIEIHGWEADPVVGWPDDYMGGELIWFNLDGYTSRSISGWVSLNDYPPDGGTEPIQMEVYLELDFSNIEKASYPDDFTTSFDASYLISLIYFPKVYYDTLDFAHLVLIENIYHQVYYGYDPAIGANAYLIYYMFYWPHEVDFQGIQFGHYYDFEPLLMYVQDIGLEPYRIVYRDIGTYTLPPKIVAQDDYASTGSGTTNVSVSTPLMPLLGDHCQVQYEIVNDYYSTPAYHYYTDHGLTPYMTVPYITITNTYHQMEIGVPPGSGEAVLTPLQNYLLPMTNDFLRWGYGKLDEAFESPINVYEGVNLWNGADYRVPDNMSLTFDMLHNPFDFPYIVDGYEEIVHYTEAKQEYRENGLYYDIDLGLSFSVPATVTLSVPTQVTTGETYDIDIDLVLDSNEIGITFDYSINLGYVLHWWFIGLEENVTYSGECNFAVNLDDIEGIVSSLGMSTESLLGEYQGGWITVTDFSTSPNLLDTMLDCTIEIHLLRILTDLLGTTGVGKLIDLVKLFMSDVDLIASPMISGYMTADLLAENSVISLDASELTFNEGATQKTVEMTVLGGASQTSIRLSNMQYHVEFA
ncbi:MAG: hypothetical protein ACXAEN_26365, partial [Candidatus Thorarchaeota archaeon]